MSDIKPRSFVITIRDVWYKTPKFGHHHYRCLISKPEFSSSPLQILISNTEGSSSQLQMSDIKSRSFVITITDVWYKTPKFRHYHYRCLIKNPEVSSSPLQMSDIKPRSLVTTITDVWYQTPNFRHHQYRFPPLDMILWQLLPLPTSTYSPRFDLGAFAHSCQPYLLPIVLGVPQNSSIF
jgi:hypothetical protein